MDEQQNQGATQDQSGGGKQTFRARYKGTGDNMDYTTDQEYTLQRWEQDGTTYLSKEDGSAELSYASEDELNNNWEELPNEEEGGEQGMGGQGGTQTP